MSTDQLSCLYRRHRDLDAYVRYDPNTDECDIVPAQSVPNLEPATPLPNRLRLSLTNPSDLEAAQRYDDAMNGKLTPDDDDVADEQDDEEFADDWDDEIADDDPHFSYNPISGRVTL